MNKREFQCGLKSAVKSVIGLVYGTFLFRPIGQTAGNMKPPTRILLLNGAHIGDVVIASSVIPILRSAYPDAEIGMLVGTWSQMVVNNHPELTYTHYVDHWRLN